MTENEQRAQFAAWVNQHIRERADEHFPGMEYPVLVMVPPPVPMSSSLDLKLGWIRGEDKRCEFCGSSEDVSFDPNPYASEIYGDERPVWMCAVCRKESADDI